MHNEGVSRIWPDYNDDNLGYCLKKEICLIIRRSEMFTLAEDALIV